MNSTNTENKSERNVQIKNVLIDIWREIVRVLCGMVAHVMCAIKRKVLSKNTSALS